MVKKIVLLTVTVISAGYFCLPLHSDELSSGSTIDLVLEAKNTTGTAKTETVEYYLPEEIVPEYIEENNGFSVELDPSRGQFYLRKSVTFDPEETKYFHFQVKNIWIIPRGRLSLYMDEAKKLRDALAGKNTGIHGDRLYKIIKQRYNEIMSAQGKTDNVKAYIEQFRIDEKKMNEIIDAIDELRKLQPLQKKRSVDLKINKGKIESIILFIVASIGILAFSFWKVWKR